MKSKAASTGDYKSGVEFLERKRKKKWVDKESGGNCFALYARSLFITWGGHENWDWKCFKESGDENVEVAKLTHVCWLDVRGKFDISDLTRGTLYEVVYEVKLTKGATGWELPIMAKLSLPNGQVKERQVILLEKPRGQWFELNVGSFQTNKDGDAGEVCFDIYEHGGHWKTGLIIRAAILRPKKSFPLTLN